MLPLEELNNIWKIFSTIRKISTHILDIKSSYKSWVLYVVWIWTRHYLSNQTTAQFCMVTTVLLITRSHDRNTTNPFLIPVCYDVDIEQTRTFANNTIGKWYCKYGTAKYQCVNWRLNQIRSLSKLSIFSVTYEEF